MRLHFERDTEDLCGDDLMVEFLYRGIDASSPDCVAQLRAAWQAEVNTGRTHEGLVPNRVKKETQILRSKLTEIRQDLEVFAPFRSRRSLQALACRLEHVENRVYQLAKPRPNDQACQRLIKDVQSCVTTLEPLLLATASQSASPQPGVSNASPPLPPPISQPSTTRATEAAAGQNDQGSDGHSTDGTDSQAEDGQEEEDVEPRPLLDLTRKEQRPQPALERGRASWSFANLLDACSTPDAAEQGARTATNAPTPDHFGFGRLINSRPPAGDNKPSDTTQSAPLAKPKPQTQSVRITTPPRPQPQRQLPPDSNQGLDVSIPYRPSEIQWHNPAPNPPPYYRHRPDVVRIMDRWGLRFSGNTRELTVEDFLFRVDRRAASEGFGDQEILIGLPNLLTDRASNWYWNRSRVVPSESWQSLRQALLGQFRSTTSDDELMDILRSRKQRPGEFFMDYQLIMEGLNARLEMPLQSAELLRLIRRNMSLRLRTALLLHPVDSLEALRDRARELEKLWAEGERFSRRQVSELHPVQTCSWTDCPAPQPEPSEYYQTDPTDFEISEINGTCWNCGTNGHTFRQCPGTAKGVFCYKCGTPGLRTPDCRRCSPGNQSSGVRPTGGSRLSSSAPARERTPRQVALHRRPTGPAHRPSATSASTQTEGSQKPIG